MLEERDLSPERIEELDQLYRDQLYREYKMRAMSSPVVDYSDGGCPHPNCSHEMGWRIDFRLELYADTEAIYKPLVRAWWGGTGFAGRCPQCERWIRFTTLRMEPISEDQARQLPQLPDQWHTLAEFA